MMSRFKISIGVCSLIVAFTASISLAAPPVEDSVSGEIASLVEEVTPVHAAAVEGNTDLVIPEAADDPVVLEGSGTDRPIEVLLPQFSDAGTAETDRDLTVFQDGEDSGVVVNPTAEGFRVTTVVGENTDEPLEYEFGENIELAVNRDGTVDIIEIVDVSDVGAEAEMTIGTVESPWAVDAEGNEVETFYEIDGSTLTQVVNVDDDHVYPIVADPEVRRVNFVQIRLRFNRAETKILAGNTTVAATGVCTAALTPVITLPGAAAVCGAQGTLIGWHANNAENSRPKKCIQLHLTPVSVMPPTFVPWVKTYSGGYCK